MQFPPGAPYIGARALLGALSGALALLGAGCHAPDRVQAPEPPIAAAVAPTNGLIGEWKLDTTGAATIAVDTKNGANATVFGGATFISGRLGNALNLDNGPAGTGGKYAEMPNTATLDTVQKRNYTLSAWFYPLTLPPDASIDNRFWTIVGKAGQHMGLVYNNLGKFSARHYVSTNTLILAQASTVYPVGSWYHVAGVVNRTAGTVRIYVNGAFKSEQTFTPNTAGRDYGTTRWRIGKMQTNWAANGRVDQVRIYNRALTDPEVSDLFNESASSAPTVTTEMATAVGTTVATLQGSANPNGSAATGWFRYSTTKPSTCNDTFGTRAPSSGGSALGSGTSPANYSRNLTGLTVRTTYYYCAIASNSAGTQFGAIRALTTVRFPVGMSKGTQNNLLGMAHTPDGEMTAGDSNTAKSRLNAARAAATRITLRVTGGNDQFQVNGDRIFRLNLWIAAFDQVGPMDLSGYIRDGTLIGHFAIDEPFSDFDNMTAQFLEDMCEHQKSFPGWRSVPCFIRDKNTRLADNADADGYQFVDAGWAQIADHHYVPPATGYNGNMLAYFEDNLQRGQDVGLGLMYGFNLLNGGRETTWPNCARPDDQDDCAMTALEVREVADALAAIGNDTGCGVNGWRIDATAGPERDYFFSQGSYSTNGIQSAMQYLNNTVGGFRPGPCNIRGDLPVP